MTEAQGTELQDWVRRLKEHEEPLVDLYGRIEQMIDSATGRELAAQIRRAQRFQLAVLDLLVQGRIPERFQCFGRVTHSRVNLRQGPSSRREKVGMLDRGVPVIIQEFQGNWAHVQTPEGADGWVFKDYVQCE